MTTSLSTILKDTAHRLLRTAIGCDIVRYNARHFYPLRRSRLLQTAGITCVADVGANTGQYALELRRSGYFGRLISFEPLLAPFQSLAERAARDNDWQCMRVAIGTHDGTASLNIAANFVSSSILPMLPTHSDAAPSSHYIGVEEAPMRSLDSLAPALFGPSDTIWLKLDVQGFEAQVLAGAATLLKSLRAIEVEMSLQSLYEGQMLYLQMIDLLQNHGYYLASMTPGFFDERTGQLLQFDGIFFRARG